MTLNLFNRNPLGFIISTLLLVVGVVLAWRLILFVAVIAAIGGAFFFIRRRVNSRRHQDSSSRGSQAHVFRDSTPHPERKILTDVEEQNKN